MQYFINHEYTSILHAHRTSIPAEIQIEEDGSVSVVELAVDQDGNEEWIASNRKLHNGLPVSLTKALKSNHHKSIKKSYELQAVISYVRGKTRVHDDYHVVHIKADQDIAKQTLSRQLEKIDECVSEKEKGDSKHLTLVTDITLEAMKSRRELVQKKLESVNEPSEDNWLLINGLKVTQTSSDDARSFCGSLKEPSIIVFREIEKQTQPCEVREALVSPDVMNTVSLSNGGGPLCGSSGGKYQVH